MDKLKIKETVKDTVYGFREKIVAKINEIVDRQNGDGPNNYKEYVAILTQSSTSDPVATVLKNTIGTITWTRANTGSYLGTATGKFTVGKTIVMMNGFVDAASNSNMTIYSAGSDNVNTVYVLTSTLNAAGGTVSTADGLLYGNGYTYVNIRVYN